MVSALVEIFYDVTILFLICMYEMVLTIIRS